MSQIVKPIKGVCNDCKNDTFEILIYRTENNLHFEHKCTKCGGFFMKEETQPEYQYKTSTRLSKVFKVPGTNITGTLTIE